MANTNYTLIPPKSRLDSKDSKILRNTIPVYKPIDFGDSTNPLDIVQMHVYDTDGNHITSVPDLRFVKGGSNPVKGYVFLEEGETNEQRTAFYTDVQQDLIDAGLLSGTYKVVYTFLRYYVAFTMPKTNQIIVPWYIQDISTSRREVRVITSVKGYIGSTSENAVSKEGFDAHVLSTQNSVELGTFLLDLGDNNFGVIINQTVSSDALLFKLYKPLPDSISEKMEVTPYFEVATPVEVYISISVQSSEEAPAKTLRGPNTNVFVSQLYDIGTAYQSWNDLLSTNPATTRDLLDHFLSSSNYTDTVNVDYSNYNNFIHFSSAEERVRNFQYKLKLLEQYDATLGALAATEASGSTHVLQNVTYYSNLKSSLLNGFDGYENWLYWESGSTYSSSLGYGIVSQSTWPKSNATYPYRLYSVSSSQGVAWFDSQVEFANSYDRDNAHNLLNTVPFHIREDEVNNESYLTFLQMIGQHYDLLWTYAKGMTQRYELKHKLNEGAARDVIWDTMKSLGMDLTNGNDVASLWKYAFGTDVTGSYTTNILQGQSGFDRMSSADATKEIWKRLFNNLSYLLKTKGTVRGIRALITCYGIPSTILRIKEYGGPEPDTIFEASKYISDEFTYALDFDGTQIVSQSWFSPKPNSVEFRFLVEPQDRQRMVLFETYNTTTPATNLKLSVTPSFTSASITYASASYKALPSQMRSITQKDFVTSSLTTTTVYGQTYATMSGYVVLEVSGGGANAVAVSNEIPVYNGAWWSVLLERTQPTSSAAYNLWVKQGRDGVILYEASFSKTLTGAEKNTWDSANVFAIGSSSIGGTAFTGTMQEFRLWSTTLNEDVFNNHVLAPLAYNGNTYSSSYYDLALRWRMNNAEWYTSGVYNTLLLDSNPTQTNTYHGYWNGPDSASVIAYNTETNYYESPSIGFRRMVSNKVRIDETLSMTGQLSREKSVVKSRYDYAPLDSNKVGVFLAPSEIINEDIIRTFAGLSYDDFIGSPLDQEKRTYYDLHQLNDFYWSKYGTNPSIYTYMKVLSYFDKSLYGQIRKMLPARADVNVGFLFEQHMLERPKVITVYPVNAANQSYTASLDIEALRQFTATTTPLTATLFTQVVSASAGYEVYGVTESIDVYPLKGVYSYNILDMEVSSSISGSSVLTLVSSSFIWSATTSLVPPASDFWLDPLSYTPITSSTGAVIGYSGSHYIFHSRHATAWENLWYNGCKQTVDTTPDKGLPFESIVAPPNILVVVDASADKPRLNVE